MCLRDLYLFGGPVAGDWLLNVEFASTVLAANGDGANDEVAFSAVVVNVLAPRPLRLRIYDLAGRQRAERSAAVTAGAQRLTWDGRDRSGALVPPGLYVVELHIAGDARQQRIRRAIPVVY